MGRRIKRLRTQREPTQTELAAQARISQGVIAQLEGGFRQSVDVHIAVRLARALGTTVEALVR